MARCGHCKRVDGKTYYCEKTNLHEGEHVSESIRWINDKNRLKQIRFLEEQKAISLKKKAEKAARKAKLEARAKAKAEKQKICFYCTRTIPKGSRTWDHVVPKSKGGSNASKNKVPCCKRCNTDKCNDLVEQYMTRQLIRFRSCSTIVGRFRACVIFLKAMMR